MVVWFIYGLFDLPKRCIALGCGNKVYLVFVAIKNKYSWYQPDMWRLNPVVKRLLGGILPAYWQSLDTDSEHVTTLSWNIHIMCNVLHEQQGILNSLNVQWKQIIFIIILRLICNNVLMCNNDLYQAQTCGIFA